MENILSSADKNEFIDFIIKNNHQQQFSEYMKSKKLSKDKNGPKGDPIKDIKEKERIEIEKIKEIKKQNRLNFNVKKHFAFRFGYIGKNYDGLVLQKHTNNTIEDKIISSLKKANLIEDFDTCNYSRCGRTDAGVSSVGNAFSVTLR